MPDPKGDTAVKIRFTADRVGIAHDALKTLEKKLGWKGPHTVMGYGEIFTVEVAVASKEVDDAMRIGYEAGLGVFGKYQRVKPSRKEDDDGDVAGKAGPSDRPAPTPRAARPASGGSSEVKSWWQCPNPDCKRHIKSGAAFHYGKSAKCLEYAKAKGLKLA